VTTAPAAEPAAGPAGGETAAEEADGQRLGPAAGPWPFWRPPRWWGATRNPWWICGITGVVSLVLTVGFLFLPLAGTDLSAQVARGHFVQYYGFGPVDFRWYGGIHTYGYSLFTGELNAVFGARGVGAMASVVGAVALAYVFVRTEVARPLTASLAGAGCQVFNLISGRTTFAFGTAVGLLAVAALVTWELPRWPRRVLTAVLAALASGASPVAGVFVALVGAALLIAGEHPGGRVFVNLPRSRPHLSGIRVDGLFVVAGAALPVAVVGMLFSDGGRQPFDVSSAKLALAESVACYFLIPARYPAVRIGAFLSALGILVSFYVASPVGANSMRLVILFGPVLVLAVTWLNRVRLAMALVALLWWNPPLVTDDLGNRGNPAAHRPFFTPLIKELEDRRPIGRIEVVPLHDHWESTFVAETVPLARGWERQVDVERNPIFYRTSFGPDDYRVWLFENAVDYVALPRNTALDRWGRAEASLIEAGLPYLDKVWENPHWELYRVGAAAPLVGGPGQLISSGPTGVTFDVRNPGTMVVRVQWSRWLELHGPDACLSPAGRWTKVTVTTPGRYRLTSGLHLLQSDRC
jgi:hypothetical protein